MLKNNFVRPEKINTESSEFQVELSLPFPLYDENRKNLIDILIAPTLVILKKAKNGDKPILPIDKKMFNQEIYKRFNGYTYSIGKLVRLAEMNLDTLQDVLEMYFSKHSAEEVFERNKKCKDCKQYDLKKGIRGLTFGNLRNILSCIIKSDKELTKIELLNTSEKRNSFTSIYDYYIQDRDRYTHGKLFFLYPEFEPVIRVLNKKTEDEYLKFTKIVFESNLKVFIYLQKVLNEIKNQIEK